MSREIYSKAKFISELNKTMETITLDNFKAKTIYVEGGASTLKPSEVRAFLFACFLNEQFGAKFTIYSDDIVKGRIRTLQCVDERQKNENVSELVAMYDIFESSFYPYNFKDLAKIWDTCRTNPPHSHDVPLIYSN